VLVAGAGHHAVVELGLEVQSIDAASSRASLQDGGRDAVAHAVELAAVDVLHGALEAVLGRQHQHGGHHEVARLLRELLLKLQALEVRPERGGAVDHEHRRNDGVDVLVEGVLVEEAALRVARGHQHVPHQVAKRLHDRLLVSEDALEVVAAQPASVGAALEDGRDEVSAKLLDLVVVEALDSVLEAGLASRHEHRRHHPAARLLGVLLRIEVQVELEAAAGAAAQDALAGSGPVAHEHSRHHLVADVVALVTVSPRDARQVVLTRQHHHGRDHVRGLGALGLLDVLVRPPVKTRLVAEREHGTDHAVDVHVLVPPPAAEEVDDQGRAEDEGGDADGDEHRRDRELLGPGGLHQRVVFVGRRGVGALGAGRDVVVAVVLGLAGVRPGAGVDAEAAEQLDADHVVVGAHDPVHVHGGLPVAREDDNDLQLGDGVGELEEAAARGCAAVDVGSDLEVRGLNGLVRAGLGQHVLGDLAHQQAAQRAAVAADLLLGHVHHELEGGHEDRSDAVHRCDHVLGRGVVLDRLRDIDDRVLRARQQQAPPVVEAHESNGQDLLRQGGGVVFTRGHRRPLMGRADPDRAVPVTVQVVFGGDGR